MRSYQYTVTDEQGNIYNNLVGVFSREFPVVTSRVNGKNGVSESVYYHGKRYHITGK